MDPVKLRPEQTMLLEQLMHQLPWPQDPIYRGIVAETIAMYDESKDRLLAMVEDQKPNQVLLFRGTELWRRCSRSTFNLRMSGEFGEREIIIFHRRTPRMVPIQEPFDPASLVEEVFYETFKRFDQRCKHCGALHYYSTSYMTNPEWLYRDEFNAKYGPGAWERTAARRAETPVQHKTEIPETK